MKRVIVNSILLSALAFGQVAWAGQLRIGTARVSGDKVTVPIMLDGDVGKGVSSLDFHLNYDPALFEPLSASSGKAASDAEKTVQANAPAKGEYVVIMMGLNQNTVTSGEVANIVLRKVGTSDSGKANLSVTQTTFASPEGVNIPSQGDQGVIQLSDKAPTTGTTTSDTPGSSTSNGQSTSTPSKDTTTTTPSKTATSTTGSSQTNATRTTTNTPAATGTTSLAGTVGSAVGKAGVGAVEAGGLAAAVKRVDAAHSTLQEQTGGAPKAGSSDGAAPATNADSTQKGATNADPSVGLDKTPGGSGTMTLAKVVTPSAAGQGEKKELEKRDLIVVQSDSAKKAGGKLGLEVALGGALIVVLGAVYFIRRKLFT